MLEENVDYELIPGEKDSWNIRILTGPYTETVVQFDQLKINKETESIHYNFTVVESPDEDLSVHDETLQEYAGDLLGSILTNAFDK